MKTLFAVLLTVVLVSAAPFKSVYDFTVKDIGFKQLLLYVITLLLL